MVTESYGKTLIADSIALIDMFLLGTVLFIVAAGLYQLFVDSRVSLPAWLRITSLDDLKSLLTGVIIVALLVAFLGSAVTWTSVPTSSRSAWRSPRWSSPPTCPCAPSRGMRRAPETGRLTGTERAIR